MLSIPTGCSFKMAAGLTPHQTGLDGLATIRWWTTSSASTGITNVPHLFKMLVIMTRRKTGRLVPHSPTNMVTCLG